MSTARSVNTDLLSRFVELTEKKRDIEQSLDETKKELAEMEQVILEQFSEANTSSVKIANGTTIFLHRQMWASALDGNHDAVCSALRDLGYNDMIKTSVNSQALSSLIRDLEREDSIPDILKQVIKLTEKFSVRTRKA